MREYSPGVLQSRLGIPASVTSRVRAGKASYSRSVRDRIRKAYRRDQTAKLRACGANKREAQDIAMAVPPDRVESYAETYLRYAKRIAKGNGVPLEHVLKGMAKSDRTLDDWDLYVKARKTERWKAREVRFRDSRGRTRRIRPRGKEH